jgi:peptidoglycan hydrolase CwlO-like protein
MPASVAILVNKDLRAIGHRLITISHLCWTLQNHLDPQHKIYGYRTEQASHESSQDTLRERLMEANNIIIDLTNKVQQSKDHIDKLQENFKYDLEDKTQKLTEKITNQKRRINEQHADGSCKSRPDPAGL